MDGSITGNGKERRQYLRLFGRVQREFLGFLPHDPQALEAFFEHIRVSHQSNDCLTP